MVQNNSHNGFWSRQQIVLTMAIILFPIIMATSLKGKHLIVLPTQFKKYMETRVNSSGHVIETNGSVPEILNWLSCRLQFNYSFLPSVTTLPTEDTPTQRGKLSYLKNNEADMVVGVIILTHQRYKQADFLMPMFSSFFGVVIPSPKLTTSVGALLHPWQFEVWVGVGLALPMFTLYLFGLGKCYSILIRRMSNQQQIPNLRDFSLDSITKHVFGVILSQGGYFGNSITFSPIRLAMAAWCLACFILVQSYSCILTSVLTVPQFAKPIITSIYDIPKVKNLHVVVDRDMGTDALFSAAARGIYKQIGTMLNNNPDLRCNKTQLCIDRVKSGHYVYIDGYPILDLAIQADYKKNGACQIVLLEERFLTSFAGFTVVKESVYMEEFNRGIEELIEYGFPQYWDKKYIVPKKSVCHYEKRQPAADKTRLSLNNLASAFVVLLLGYSFSFFVFLIENIFHRRIA